MHEAVPIFRANTFGAGKQNGRLSALGDNPSAAFPLIRMLVAFESTAHLFSLA